MTKTMKIIVFLWFLLYNQYDLTNVGKFELMCHHSVVSKDLPMTTPRCSLVGRKHTIWILDTAFCCEYILSDPDPINKKADFPPDNDQHGLKDEF